MKTQSVAEIRRLYQQITPADLPAFVAQYQSDRRKVVCDLVARAERQLARLAQRRDHLAGLHQFDLAHQPTGRVIGIDEAGRGPLAGPVVAAACVIEPCEDLLGLDDSKKLSAAERDRLYQVIVSRAISYGVGIVDNRVIDQINILNATKRAMTMALQNADKCYRLILTDCVQLTDVDLPLRPIVKGDAKSLAIAAASVIAKVTRDRLMLAYHRRYPQYGFDQHKGYGTAQHIAALRRYGSCPLHRNSFTKNFLE